MFTKDEILSLDTIADGAALYRFQEELQKVIDDILDPNTKPNATRKVILTLAIVPDEERNVAGFYVDCISKLAPVKPITGSIAIGKSSSGGVAREFKGQEDWIKNQEKQKVQPLRKVERGGEDD